MPLGGDPVAAAVGRRMASLPDKLTIIDRELGTCEVLLAREVSYQLYRLLNVKPDENGVLYAVDVKEGALKAAATAEGSDRIN